MKGFTLIEVLVVIAIVGLLSTVVVDSVRGSKKEDSQTEEQTCQKYSNWSQKDLPVKCLKYYK